MDKNGKTKREKKEKGTTSRSSQEIENHKVDMTR
jgi:hypothetical protein